MLRIATIPMAALVVAGCASVPTHLVESDVPAPAGMKVRYSTNLKRDGGLLSGGWFILWGTVTDINVAADGTVSRFQENGWRLVEKSMLPKRAGMTFSKDSRTARVDIDARRIDPESSSATVSVADSGPAVTSE